MEEGHIYVKIIVGLLKERMKLPFLCKLKFLKS
jgi:hypothetical protein